MAKLVPMKCDMCGIRSVIGGVLIFVKKGEESPAIDLGSADVIACPDCQERAERLLKRLGHKLSAIVVLVP